MSFCPASASTSAESGKRSAKSSKYIERERKGKERLTTRIVLQHPQISHSIRNHEPDLSLTDKEISRHDVLMSIVLSEHDELEGILLQSGTIER